MDGSHAATLKQWGLPSSFFIWSIYYYISINTINLISKIKIRYWWWFNAVSMMLVTGVREALRTEYTEKWKRRKKKLCWIFFGQSFNSVWQPKNVKLAVEFLPGLLLSNKSQDKNQIRDKNINLFFPTNDFSSKSLQHDIFTIPAKSLANHESWSASNLA